jgi:hypothetical protein
VSAPQAPAAPPAQDAPLSGAGASSQELVNAMLRPAPAPSAAGVLGAVLNGSAAAHNKSRGWSLALGVGTPDSHPAGCHAAARFRPHPGPAPRAQVLNKSRRPSRTLPPAPSSRRACPRAPETPYPPLPVPSPSPGPHP